MSTTVTFASNSFKKEISSDTTKYTISDSVVVLNGMSEKVTIFFRLSCPKNVWEQEITDCNKKYPQSPTSDTSHFKTIVHLLNLDAKFKCKNMLSFQPIQGTFISYYEKNNSYMCLYNCMARNGYGNLIEGQILSEYKQ